MKPPTTYPHAPTVPYFLRLSVDIDPSCHPLGFHATVYREGREDGVTVLGFPGPFDTAASAWSELLTTVDSYHGEQGVLW